MKIAFEHIVSKDYLNKRIYDYLNELTEFDYSRKSIKKRLNKGLVKRNNKTIYSSDYVHKNDLIQVFEEFDSRPIYEFPIELIFEDEYLAIVNKPAGILVNGNSFRTVENALPHNLKMSSLEDAVLFPQAAHRLDYPTTGLLLIGKTRTAIEATKQLFADRKVTKTYKAITIGKMPSIGNINTKVNGSEASSQFELIKSVPSNKHVQFNLVDLNLDTGRRHQLRIHLASIGFPILGDRDYGEEKHLSMKKGLYLQASSLVFIHPFTKENVSITIDLPNKFKKLLNRT